MIDPCGPVTDSLTCSSFAGPTRRRSGRSTPPLGARRVTRQPAADRFPLHPPVASRPTPHGSDDRFRRGARLTPPHHTRARCVRPLIGHPHLPAVRRSRHGDDVWMRPCQATERQPAPATNENPHDGPPSRVLRQPAREPFAPHPLRFGAPQRPQFAPAELRDSLQAEVSRGTLPRRSTPAARSTTALTFPPFAGAGTATIREVVTRPPGQDGWRHRVRPRGPVVAIFSCRSSPVPSRRRSAGRSGRLTRAGTSGGTRGRRRRGWSRAGGTARPWRRAGRRAQDRRP